LELELELEFAPMPLSDELLALRARLPEILAPIAGGRGTILVTERAGVGARLSMRDERVWQADPSRGAVLSASREGALHESATSDLRPESLASAARDLAAGVGCARGDVSLPDRRDFASAMKIDPASIPLAEKIDRLRILRDAVAKRDPRLCAVAVGFNEARELKIFAGDGKDYAQEVSRLTLSLVVFIAKDGETRQMYTVKGWTGGFEEAFLADEEIADTVETAVQLLTARRIEPGTYDVVASPEVAGLVAHESFGHGVELDMFVRDRARAKEYFGKRVGTEKVSLSDDPTVPGAYGSYFFDDEGQLATPTRVLREGVLVSGLADRASAGAVPHPRTANGRRESFRNKAYARMSNTFIEPGTSTFEECLAACGDGVFLDRGGAGMEDPKGWGTQVECAVAREVRGGKLTGVVYAPVVLTGFLPDLLGSVTHVSREFRLSPGMCGKGHKEYVDVSSGGPHVRMRARLG